MAYFGHPRVNSATYLVKEYGERMSLAELGFNVDLSSLPAWKADAFMIIKNAYNKLRKSTKK